MRSPPLRPTVVLLLACLLAVLLFLPALALPGAHFWGSYLLPIVVVFLWGRRRDIYVVTAVASVLVIAGFWFGGTSPTPTYFVVNHLLPLGVLWGVAWLLAQRHQMQDDLARQRQELVHQQQVLEKQVAARTAKLRASEHKYRDLFDDSPDMYVAATAGDHIIRECNLTLARTLGYTREELIGRPAAMLLTRASYTAGRAYWPAYVAAGSLANLEVQLQCKDGTVLDVLGSGHYHPATDGQPAYSRITFHDITERKRSEERLREALQRLQLATDVAEIGIWNWNIADGSLEWDDRTCDLYAVPSDQRSAGLYYDLWRARVHPDDIAEADAARGNPDLLPDRWIGTYRIVLPGGAIRYVQSAAVKMYARDARLRQMIGVVRDVTEQVHYEQLLQETNAELEQRVAARTADLEAALADLEAANRLKGEFMAMISHELRTPLTGVLSLSELLEDQIAGPLNARQATYVKGIVASGERLLYVINSILGYTQLLAGELQLQRERCDLAYLVNVCAVSQRAKAEAKQQVIEEHVEPAGFSIESDAEAVSDILKRLLDNAIKFTPAGGRVGIYALAGTTPGAVQIVIWDTGPGLAGDQLERLVKPFAQGDGSLARSHEGIGIGLAYVDALVRRLGGTLDLAPNPGGGSRFMVMLPA